MSDSDYQAEEDLQDQNAQKKITLQEEIKQLKHELSKIQGTLWSLQVKVATPAPVPFSKLQRKNVVESPKFKPGAAEMRILEDKKQICRLAGLEVIELSEKLITANMYSWHKGTLKSEHAVSLEPQDNQEWTVLRHYFPKGMFPWLCQVPCRVPMKGDGESILKYMHRSFMCWFNRFYQLQTLKEEHPNLDFEYPMSLEMVSLVIYLTDEETKQKMKFKISLCYDEFSIYPSDIKVVILKPRIHSSEATMVSLVKKQAQVFLNMDMSEAFVLGFTSEDDDDNDVNSNPQNYTKRSRLSLEKKL